MRKVTDGVIDVIVYPSAADKAKNRGFAFVEYGSHRAAAMARRKLLPGNVERKGILACLTLFPFLHSLCLLAFSYCFCLFYI